MNRFEIIAERIGVLSKDIPEDLAMFALNDSVRKLDEAMRGILFDEPDEPERIKMLITDVMYELLMVANKRGHCGACICGDLEEKLKPMAERVEGVSMTVMQPTVVNENNIPAEKISERGFFDPGTLKYLIKPEVFNISGVGNAMSSQEKDSEDWLSVFNLPVNFTTVISDEFCQMLCVDLLKCTGYEWTYKQVAGFVSLQSKHKIPDIALMTKCCIEGEGIKRLK